MQIQKILHKYYLEVKTEQDIYNLLIENIQQILNLQD